MERARMSLEADWAHRRGITGKGVGIAVLDTGIAAGHPDFSGIPTKLAAFCDCIGKKNTPYDDNGHGTHVSGIAAGRGIASSGKFTGLAPDSHLIVIKVLDRRGNGDADVVMKGIRWTMEHRKAYGIRVVNISVGALPRKGIGEGSRLLETIEEAWDCGLTVVTAAGNQGPGIGSVTTPGICRKVITVGCCDDNRLVRVGSARLRNYSGRGPTESCIVKPEVVAPGSEINSCQSAFQNGSFYCQKSGSSMATPMVSGAIALLLSIKPWLTNAEVKLRLYESCSKLDLSKNQQGWGLLNVRKLLEG